jgi:hypothetical protein
MMDERALVARQLGREPRGAWDIAVRCSFGRPTVITTAPRLPDGTPFPTLYYLTCPYLVAAVGRAESDGGVSAWRVRLAGDRTLAARMHAADTAYCRARTALAGGSDPTPDAGIAGQDDPLATKCLHAHVAAFLAGIDDPVGEGVLAGCARECSDDRCGKEE